MRMPAHADGGFSLIELMVSMALMSVVTALFTTGIVQVYRAQNFTDGITETSVQIHDAFIRLDSDVRYASGISVPGAAAGNQYVEYDNTNSGSDVCTQLRLTPNGLLQLRRKAGTAAASAWSVLASQLTAPSATSFARTPATANGNAYQQLSVTLTAQPAGSSAQQESSSYTFTALNTSLDTASDTVCNSLDRT